MSNAYLKAAASNLIKAAQEKIQNKNQLLQDADRLRRSASGEVENIKRIVHEQEARAATTDSREARVRTSTDALRLNKEAQDMKIQAEATAADMEKTAQLLHKEAEELQRMAKDLEMRA